MSIKSFSETYEIVIDIMLFLGQLICYASGLVRSSEGLLLCGTFQQGEYSRDYLGRKFRIA